MPYETTNDRFTSQKVVSEIQVYFEGATAIVIIIFFK